MSARASDSHQLVAAPRLHVDNALGALKSSVENLLHEGGLTRARDSSHDDQTTQGEFHVEVPQIVLASTADADLRELLDTSRALYQR